MTFRPTCTTKNFSAAYRVLKYNAKKYVLQYSFGADELLLDKFLRQNYHISLKELCLTIINYCTFYNDTQNIIVKILNKKYDNLATLITYGNEQVFGSKILQEAFM
jgi:hypothetical protein